MRKLTTLGAVGTVVVMLCSVSPAQVANRNRSRGAVPPAAAVPPAQEFWGGVPMMNRASTAAQGALMGIADTVRAAGAASMMNSAAAMNVEAARSQYIDNRLKGTEASIEIRRMKREYRDSKRRPRPTSEQIYRLAKEATPRALNPGQYNPITGQITWPTALMLDEFEEYRETLDDLFWDKSVASGTLSLRQINQARSTTQEMRDLLRAKINDMPPQIFTQSSAFLRQLDHAATQAGL